MNKIEKSDACRYVLKFPTSATYGDKILIEGDTVANVKIFIGIGRYFQDQSIVEYAFTSKFRIEVDYPYNAYVVAILYRARLKTGAFKLQYAFIKNRNP